MKNVCNTIDSKHELFILDSTVKNSSQLVFSLYEKVRALEIKYEQICGGGYNFVNMLICRKRTSSSLDNLVDMERWFLPFIESWLNHLERLTVEWVGNAIKEDTFEATYSAESSQVEHSSSIRDVLSAIYQQLDFIADLKWHDSVQNAKFLQTFARIISKAMEHYCRVIIETEMQQSTSIGNIGWQEILEMSAKAKEIALSGGKLPEKAQDIPLAVINNC